MSRSGTDLGHRQLRPVLVRTDAGYAATRREDLVVAMAQVSFPMLRTCYACALVLTAAFAARYPVLTY